ncbi:DUF6310 domain-containing protein [Archangium violaceum]|uniref:DUF6310 domain-containing protein n=1 Tax=Archangium violaceum Cb vi76 TaxID=1406225 RepID=A0A084SP68_9BACT|nr:DUF6310 domain-containing protein [Archangium violaceum]KFA90253.1 hypothetical protein Q664_30290 [Archangium violaceum Cb vi76]
MKSVLVGPGQNEAGARAIPRARSSCTGSSLSEFAEESRIARACGYDFVVGGSTEEHKAALMPALEEAGLQIKVVVTRCKR